MLICILLLILCSLLCLGANDFSEINIGVCIDEVSMRDSLLLIGSVYASHAHIRDNIVLYILACGANSAEADKLEEKLISVFKTCFPYSRYHIAQFTAHSNPTFSTLHKRLMKTRPKRRSSFISESGTDFARLFLPSIFPHLGRFLYLDNDIVVACCIEKVWRTPMDVRPDIVVALVMDKSQPKRQKKSSGPKILPFQLAHTFYSSNAIFTENMRRGTKFANASLWLQANTSENSTMFKNSKRKMSDAEFSSIMNGIYPNNGVLLFNATAYRELKILDRVLGVMDAINNGTKVLRVIGCQAITVLTMHENWIALHPVANLRSVPQLARWDLKKNAFHGFLHFAGLMKPNSLCNNARPPRGWVIRDRIETFTTYTWAIRQLRQQCFSSNSSKFNGGVSRYRYNAPMKLPEALQTSKMSNLFKCADDFIEATTIQEFFSILRQYLRTSYQADDNGMNAYPAPEVYLRLLSVDQVARVTPMALNSPSVAARGGLSEKGFSASARSPAFCNQGNLLVRTSPGADYAFSVDEMSAGLISKKLPVQNTTLKGLLAEGTHLIAGTYAAPLIPWSGQKVVVTNAASPLNANAYRPSPLPVTGNPSRSTNSTRIAELRPSRVAPSALSETDSLVEEAIAVDGANFRAVYLHGDLPRRDLPRQAKPKPKQKQPSFSASALGERENVNGWKDVYASSAFPQDAFYECTSEAHWSVPPHQRQVVAHEGRWAERVTFSHICAESTPVVGGDAVAAGVDVDEDKASQRIFTTDFTACSSFCSSHSSFNSLLRRKGILREHVRLVVIPATACAERGCKHESYESESARRRHVTAQNAGLTTTRVASIPVRLREIPGQCSALSTLRSIDLDRFRPRFVLVQLALPGSAMHSGLFSAGRAAVALLARKGFHAKMGEGVGVGELVVWATRVTSAEIVNPLLV
jgi:lipopolysaccharide biosynthesis glycosyltransferase